jgi:hypothetical protein
VSAKYGFGDNWIDVTETLDSSIKDDKLHYWINNGVSAGVDPALGKYKQCIIIYVLDRKTKKVTVAGESWLTLP